MSKIPNQVFELKLKNCIHIVEDHYAILLMFLINSFDYYDIIKNKLKRSKIIFLWIDLM